MDNGIDYGWKPDWIAKPAEGAVEQDLTRATLVLDETNAIGETYHWEVEPYDQRQLPTRNTDSAADKNGKVFVYMVAEPFFRPDVVASLK